MMLHVLIMNLAVLSCVIESELPLVHKPISSFFLSGQVRILSADGYDDDDDEDDETFIQRATALVSRPPEGKCLIFLIHKPIW